MHIKGDPLGNGIGWSNRSSAASRMLCSVAFCGSIRERLPPEGFLMTNVTSFDGQEADAAAPAALAAASFTTALDSLQVPSLGTVRYFIGTLTPEPETCGGAAPRRGHASCSRQNSIRLRRSLSRSGSCVNRMLSLVLRCILSPACLERRGRSGFAKKPSAPSPRLEVRRAGRRRHVHSNVPPFRVPADRTMQSPAAHRADVPGKAPQLTAADPFARWRVPLIAMRRLAGTPDQEISEAVRSGSRDR